MEEMAEQQRDKKKIKASKLKGQHKKLPLKKIKNPKTQIVKPRASSSQAEVKKKLAQLISGSNKTQRLPRIKQKFIKPTQIAIQSKIYS